MPFLFLFVFGPIALVLYLMVMLVLLICRGLFAIACLLMIVVGRVVEPKQP